MELLAPAGSLPVALAAFDAGADAVYCGLKKFNARERSDNFSSEEMSKLIAYAHKIGKKVYITFNTLLKESELKEAADSLAELHALRPDALIVQDIGAVRMIREFFPELVIHGSTQMALHDSCALESAEKMGIRRVILERQVTLPELESIARNTTLELEVFVHGALCACLSGTCLFSSWLVGLSGNRGKCKQPCRRIFRSEKQKNAFYLSTRDLAAIELIPKFRELGIASLKIEGRLRKADYVAAVVSAYRKALDHNDFSGANGILDRTCARERSLGFYTEKSMRDLIRRDVPGGVGLFCGKVLRVFQDSFEVELAGRIHVGDNIRVQSSVGDEGDALTVLEMSIGGRSVKKAFPGQICRIGNRSKSIMENGILYKIGQTHDSMEKRCAALPLQKPPVDFALHLSASGLRAELGGEKILTIPLDLSRAEQHAVTDSELIAAFRISGNSEFSSGRIQAVVDENLFLPQSILKSLRQEFWKWIDSILSPETVEAESRKKAESVKLFLDVWKKQEFPAEKNVCFLPGNIAGTPGITTARNLEDDPKAGEECILPMFTPEKELPDLKEKIRTLFINGVRVFRAAALSHFALLSEFPGAVIKTAPPLPAANSFAVQELRSLGAVSVLAHLELAREDLSLLRERSALPLEQYCFGRPAILATRAAIADVKFLTDSKGERFQVLRTRHLTVLYPEIPMKTEPLNGFISVTDLRFGGSDERNASFNFERGFF